MEKSEKSTFFSLVFKDNPLFFRIFGLTVKSSFKLFCMSLSHRIYSDSRFATQYATSIMDNAWNACYERPASLSLLPKDITGKRILDAGCGPGIVSKYLWERGAIVTAVDYSDKMIALTNEITSGGVSAMVMDLNNGLTDFEDSYFDIIYCSLVIHYLEDLNFLFSEFARVLTTGGLIIFSTDHPQGPAQQGKNLSNKQLESVYWKGFNVYLELYHRPWSEIEDALRQSHLDIELAITPQIIEECKKLFPEEYALLKENPHFICVRARKGV
jgi:SAM-dependent methyltransferase